MRNGEIRIGVSGHRLLTKKQEIKAGIDEVLAHIAATFPGRDWVILSSLAEGADCLFVQKARQRQAVKLIVPLPMPVDHYLETFTTRSARREFLRLYQGAEKTVNIEPKLTSEKAFLAAGMYIVQHCELLVTIWNGQEALGLGGTGQIVALTRKKLLPMAWIHADNHRQRQKPIPAAERQGAVTFERFPAVESEERKACQG